MARLSYTDSLKFMFGLCEGQFNGHCFISCFSLRIWRLKDVTLCVYYTFAKTTNLMVAKDLVLRRHAYF